MKKIILYLCLLVSISALAENLPRIINPVEAFLNANLQDRRNKGFHKVMDLMKDRNIRTIVETGTARGGIMAFTGDGGFTIIFGLWALLHKAHLYSVDISETAIVNAKTMVEPYMDVITFIQDDSVHYLQNFDGVIDFLYLDSFDYEIEDPVPSQWHHLKEIEAAYDKLTDQSIVMIDDCDMPGGGKGRLAIDYLTARGWRVVFKSYQVILVRH